MNVTLEIPDDVAQRLSAVGGDLSRRALEARWRKSTNKVILRNPTFGACLTSKPVTK